MQQNPVLQQLYPSSSAHEQASEGIECQDFCHQFRIFHLFHLFLSILSLALLFHQSLMGTSLFKSTKAKDHPSSINGQPSFA
jgi:hypothetical protein